MSCALEMGRSGTFSVQVLSEASGNVTAVMGKWLAVTIDKQRLHGVQVVGVASSGDGEGHGCSGCAGDGGCQEKAAIDRVAEHPEGVKDGLRG